MNTRMSRWLLLIAALLSGVAHGQTDDPYAASPNRQIFTGHEHDAATGLIYMKGRYYDPEIGRFITQDSWLGDINDPISLNRYIYAHANPTRYTDPTGHCVVPLLCTAVGGAAGAYWGTTQAIGRGIYDAATGDVDFGRYASLIVQNAIGGAEIGATVDVVVDTGGTLALPVGGALGSAGFGALTITGEPEAWSNFGSNQVRDSALGAIAGPIAAKAASAASAALGTAAQTLLARIGIGAGTGAVSAGGAETSVQGYEMALGAREEIDTRQIAYVTAGGTFFGAVGGAAYHATQKTSYMTAEDPSGMLPVLRQPGGPNPTATSPQSRPLYRYVGEGEADVIRRTGKIPNIDAAKRPKPVYITDRLYETAGRAKTHLQLRSKPNYRVEIDPAAVPDRTPLTRVRPEDNPQFGKGGGTESITNNQIFVDPTTLHPLKGAPR